MKILAILLILAAATGLSACGQRVMPQEPVGKVRSSNAY